jgi:hypothetical protein
VLARGRLLCFDGGTPAALVVGQFVVNKIDCLTEPSAVALDAGVKLRTKQFCTPPRSFSGC